MTNRLEQILSQWHEEHRQQFIRDGYANLLDTFDTREQKHTHVLCVNQFRCGTTDFDRGNAHGWKQGIQHRIV